MSGTKTLLIIAGPTAVGKTGIAIRVAKHFGTSIISADSRQCYQGMAIGTAQPSVAELATVPHYFINEYPVEAALNAGDFERLALGYLDEIFAQRDIAIASGGTGLYLKALTSGLDEMPNVDEQIRAEAEAAYKERGLSWLQEETRIADPVFFAQADTANPVRLMRALTFMRATGKSILDYQSAQPKERNFYIVKVALDLPRELLYNRINQRVDVMMEAGLLAEAETLYPLRHLKNLQTVGYAELFDFLSGKSSLPDAVNLIKQHSRNYAKRQLTWFRKDPAYQWLQADDPEILTKIINLAKA